MRDSSQEAMDARGLQILDSVNPFTWGRAIATIRGLEPDLVLFEWWTPFLAPVIGTVARLLRRAGFKCVFECHNVLPHESMPLSLPLIHYGLATASAFIVFSKQNQAFLRDYFPDTSSFYTPLPAPFTFPARSARSGTTILFFGIVRPYKGLDTLLHAMRIIIAEVKCKLIVAGEFYEPIDKYTSLIRQFGLESVVELNDRYIPNEEIPGFLDRADVLVLPYRSATQSGVLTMALASGLPVVASDVGAFADQVETDVNGLLVRPADPVSLASALIRYFKNGLGPAFAQHLLSAKGPSAGPQRGCTELVHILESLGSPPA
jgi:glycosyltransferase involved in cell wall biosynthesis